MPRFPFLFALLLLSLFPSPPVRAQFGQTAKVFDVTATRLLADPARPRVYASLSGDNTVLVVNTTDLSVAAVVDVGSAPAGMSISPDGTRLYVACRGTTVAAISVVDLDTFQVLSPISLPDPAANIVAGNDGRLYVSTTSGQGGILQVDSATGAIMGPELYEFGTNILLQISPDHQTLYADISSTLHSYDVSTPARVPLQSNIMATMGQETALVLSHDGTRICLPDYGSTKLYSTANLNSSAGSFLSDYSNLAFSADDAVAYQAGNGVLEAFDTQTFASLGRVPLYVPSPFSSDFPVSDLVVDHTDSYVFYCEPTNYNHLVVALTGRGSSLSAEPGASVVIKTHASTITRNELGTFKLKRTGDLSQPLTLQYKIKGFDAHGFVFRGSDGTTTFAAGAATVKIEVSPAAIFRFPIVQIKLKLKLEPFYVAVDPGFAIIQVTN